MFSAGLDLITLSKLDRSGADRFWGQFFGLLKTIGACPVPMASAITGHSPAGGAVMAIHGDYRVMSKGDFKIGLNEVQVGLVVPRQIQRVLARLVGIRRAERLLVAGALLSPQEALHAGLVDDVVEGYEETIARAIEWCRKRTALPHNAMSGTRKIIRADMVSNYDDLEEADMKAFSDVWFSEETQRIIGQVLQKLQKKAG
jgi:enoyl-CoA hydratase/carnithine racemase